VYNAARALDLRLADLYGDGGNGDGALSALINRNDVSC
jgi:hypothetical protein